MASPVVLAALGVPAVQFGRDGSYGIGDVKSSIFYLNISEKFSIRHNEQISQTRSFISIVLKE